MKFDFKVNIKFVIITLFVSLIFIPFIFNFLFMWDSGWSKGKTSDWFSLYGNIFGGLLGGFFTYLALLLTFKDKNNELRPTIDIPHQMMEFVETSDTLDFKSIPIELNNTGGSIAKNIECSLSISNYDEVLIALEDAKKHLKIDKIENIGQEQERRMNLIVCDDEANQKKSLGNVYNKYNSEFVGSCVPLVLNYEAKTQYILEPRLSYWVDYIIQNRHYTKFKFNVDELFKLKLEIKYSSDKYGDFTEVFDLEWVFIGIWIGEGSQTKYKYVLKSTKVNTQ